ncbi:hypothetical protein BBJ28_00005312 [Nothophytophthora sp. Chile5]|nr:hypothetical protein BBJ28_00005312 [Nothophytophthora sp. Chile5]
MTLAHLPSLASSQLQHHPVLPSLRATRQLNHRFPQQYVQQPQHFSGASYYPSAVMTASRKEEALDLPSVCAPASSGRDLALTGPLRRGKWTRAEEDYAAATISYFCDGLLAIQYGTTLRGYLAQQLHCDPMRISKKLLPGSVFAGIKINPKIGRRAYYPCAQDSPAAALSKANAARHLTTLRRAFIQSIEEEEQAQEANSSSSSSHATKPVVSSSKSASSASEKNAAAIGRKRSYDDINRVVRAQQQRQEYPTSVELTEPQIFYHFQRQAAPALFSVRYAASSNAAVSTSATSPVLCKLPKLTVSDDVAHRSPPPTTYSSYSSHRRSTSPVAVTSSATVLPPLRVSLVRASMC